MEIHQIERDGTAFQQPVDEQDLRVELSRALAGESIREVIELKAGWFNNTYRINTSGKAYILKVAPEQEADVFFNERDLMRREKTIAQQLQSLSPLVPEYLSFFSIGGRDASLQPFIEGRIWHDVTEALSEAENTELWKQLGVFAKLLHGRQGERFGYPPPGGGFGRWSQFIEYNVEGLSEDCRRFGVFCDEIEMFLKSLPRFQQRLDRVDTACLLHGDLWPRNVIIEGSGMNIHIKAVIDGERAFWGDPVSDWVLILYGVPEAFWQGYGGNLPEISDPACIAVYKGMYFMVNMLEAVRFRKSADTPRQWLSAINRELDKM